MQTSLASATGVSPWVSTPYSLSRRLWANPVDLAKVKQQFQAIAAKEVDLHLAHVTALEEIRKVLTPEQQQQFKTLQGRMRHEGGRREHHERD
jgi:Spy/CpxP family protein refolding chaperone